MSPSSMLSLKRVRAAKLLSAEDAERAEAPLPVMRLCERYSDSRPERAEEVARASAPSSPDAVAHEIE